MESIAAEKRQDYISKSCATVSSAQDQVYTEINELKDALKELESHLQPILKERLDKPEKANEGEDDGSIDENFPQAPAYSSFTNIYLNTKEIAERLEEVVYKINDLKDRIVL